MASDRMQAEAGWARVSVHTAALQDRIHEVGERKAGNPTQPVVHTIYPGAPL
jgi:hypothetical protein